MKKYPLDIEVWTGDQTAIFSRGHHDIAAFKSSAIPYQRDYEELWPNVEFAEPERQWWRVIPSGEGDGSTCVILAQPHSRGAYPVTTMEEK